jgi:hypothetical protein
MPICLPVLKWSYMPEICTQKAGLLQISDLREPCNQEAPNHSLDFRLPGFHVFCTSKREHVRSMPDGTANQREPKAATKVPWSPGRDQGC